MALLNLMKSIGKSVSTQQTAGKLTSFFFPGGADYQRTAAARDSYFLSVSLDLIPPDRL